MAGLTSPPFMGIYNVTKHAVVTLSETLFAELSLEAADVGVSVLCPGWVKTRIGEADRNRPGQATLADAAEDGDQADVPRGPEQLPGHRPRAARRRRAGASTAVRDRRFYVLTHPDWKPMISQPGREHRQRTGSAAGDAPRGLTRDQRGGSGSPRGGSESRPRVSCTTGPIVRAKTTVPMPTVPPSAQPTASARELDPGPDQPDRAPAAGEPGHDPVPRARGRGRRRCRGRRRRPAMAMPPSSIDHSCDGPARLGQPGQHQVHHRPDEHRVEDRADAGPLAQRDPHEQQHEPGDDGDRRRSAARCGR